VGCSFCGKFLAGKQRKFCCKKCQHDYEASHNVTLPCVDCGCLTVFRAHSMHGRFAQLCGVCTRVKSSKLLSARNKILYSDPTKTPRWKGGHKHYSPGRHGRDKDGLSWKTQRKLAWERDNLICKHCGKKDELRRPDVHHILPWPISQSHALDNLLCLCRSCHSKADGKCHDKWGGQLVDPNVPKAINPETICLCGRRKRAFNILCGFCRGTRKVKKDPSTKKLKNYIPVRDGVKDNSHVERAKEMRLKGLTYAIIAKEFNVSRQAVFYWLNPKKVPSVEE